MTRTVCVSDMLGPGQGRRRRQNIPREGTAIRAEYDALRRGEFVKLTRNTAPLTDFYGMDIGFKKNFGYFLRGEWEGPYYVRFERILQDDA